HGPRAARRRCAGSRHDLAQLGERPSSADAIRRHEGIRHRPRRRRILLRLLHGNQARLAGARHAQDSETGNLRTIVVPGRAKRDPGTNNHSRWRMDSGPAPCGASRNDEMRQGAAMPIPKHIFDPPFNIIRSSHVVLDVTDLKASRAFYETTIGLHVEDADSSAVYLRGSEEQQHHSLVLRKAQTAACSRLGFKVGNDGDLDKAAAFFSENGVQYKFAEQPFQGRTLQFTDPFGFQIELYATM